MSHVRRMIITKKPAEPSWSAFFGALRQGTKVSFVPARQEPCPSIRREALYRAVERRHAWRVGGQGAKGGPECRRRLPL